MHRAPQQILQRLADDEVSTAVWIRDIYSILTGE
jgi:hypothetical protein